MIEVFATTTQIVLNATVISATGFFGYCMATDIWKYARNASVRLPVKSEPKALNGVAIASKSPPQKSTPQLSKSIAPVIGNGAIAHSQPTEPVVAAQHSTPESPTPEPIVAVAATPPVLPQSQPSMPELEPIRPLASTALIPYQPHPLKANDRNGSSGRSLVVSPQKSLTVANRETRALQTAVDPISKALVEVTSTAPQRTNLAGFWCLLALQERLGMAGFLEAHPHLKAARFSHRLLWELAGRFGIPEDDPVRGPLGRVDASAIAPSYRFVAPPLWQQGIYRQGTWSIHPWEGQPEVRVLFDGSGQLAVALWTEGTRDIEAVWETIGERNVARGAAIVSTLNLTFLLRAWGIAMRRWCRRFARMGLSDLVAQPGWVYLTPTQIVVEFESECLDRRIRQAGLNLDVKALPGWERDLIFD